MAKFRKEEKKSVKAISTSSLPDIVFMLLIFFMVSTSMRQVDLRVRVKTPEATEIKKLEQKSLVSYIYIGKPQKKFERLFGTEPRVQLNDQISTVTDIRDFIAAERDAMDEVDRQLMTVSLKIDENTKMGVVEDVKQALRKANALKINYSARRAAPKSQEGI